jgi:glycerol kinase
LLQEEFPDPEVLIGTLDSYLVQQFTGDVRFITDDSMAARTLLYSLERAKWDPELCSFWGVNADRLPSIQPSLGQHGTYRGIPVRALLGDQQAGLFGRLAEGIKVVLNLGTITSLCVCTGSEPQRANGFVSSVLYSAGEHEREHTYLLEAITSSSGALIDLLQKKLEIASGIEQLHELCEKAKPDAAVAFLPLGGADTPAWRYDLPCLASAPINERSPEFAKAAIEHIGFSIANHIIGMRKSPGLLDGLTSIVVSGGLSDLNYLMQFIADVSEVELVRLSSREGGARGAAIAALTQTLGGKISLPRDRAVRTFTPHPHKHSQRLNTWKKLREQAWSGSFESSQLVSLPA